MGQQVLRAGSTKKKKILEGWKSYKNSVWELHIDATTVKRQLLKVQLENEKKL